MSLRWFLSKWIANIENQKYHKFVNLTIKLKNLAVILCFSELLVLLRALLVSINSVMTCYGTFNFPVIDTQSIAQLSLQGDSK